LPGTRGPLDFAHLAYPIATPLYTPNLAIAYADRDYLQKTLNTLKDTLNNVRKQHK